MCGVELGGEGNIGKGYSMYVNVIGRHLDDIYSQWVGLIAPKNKYELKKRGKIRRRSKCSYNCIASYDYLVMVQQAYFQTDHIFRIKRIRCELSDGRSVRVRKRLLATGVTGVPLSASSCQFKIF